CPPSSPLVKTTLPPAQTLEKPAPTPAAFHARGGPPPGHCLSSPLSGEWALRLGPRNWFQSRSAASVFFAACASPGVGVPAATTTSRIRARIRDERFTIPPPVRVAPYLTFRKPLP